MEDSNTENDGAKVIDISQLIGISTTDTENDEGVEASFFLLPPANKVTRDEPSAEPEEIDDDDDDDDDGEHDGQAGVWEGGEWNCRPYKSEVLKAEILQANRKGSKGQAAILSTLQSNGVRIYVVDSNVSANITEIMASVLKVIMHVTKQKRCRTCFDPWQSQRCLLYKDQEGRFFNLTLADYTSAPAGTFKALLDSFSGFQATSVLTVLCRSFACATQSEIIIDQFRPAYLSLLLAIVFYEEVSYSWIYTAMFVRGVPSISAYTVTSNVETDWLRKVLIFTLALGGATTGRLQVVLTLFGISLTCAVLLANLGSRAWGFLKWRPLPYGGPVTPIIAYLAAILAGIAVPYMGHRRIEAGGKAAMESVIISAVLVAAVFILSDYDSFQQFLVIGSEDVVNISVGIWWSMSFLVSLFLVLRIEPANVFPEEEELLLEESHSSPVGFKVPNLPDFPIDPNLAQKGLSMFDIRVEFLCGVFLALGIGSGIVYLAFTDFDENIFDIFESEEVDSLVPERA